MRLFKIRLMRVLDCVSVGYFVGVVFGRVRMEILREPKAIGVRISSKVDQFPLTSKHDYIV